MIKFKKKISVFLVILLIANVLLNMGYNSKNNTVRLGQAVFADTVETKIAAGYKHTLMLLDDGTVWAWGNNQYGQLGDGTTTSTGVPEKIEGLENVVDIDCGMYHSLALKSDGTVWAWGNNSSGQLGDGTLGNRLTPVQLSGISNVIVISSYNYHTIALKNDGTVWTWGNNNQGQLGLGDTTSRHSPTIITTLSNIGMVASGGDYCIALKNDGTVWTWGSNTQGQLGNGDTNIRFTPTRVSSINNLNQISPGGSHNMVIKNDGTLWTWGNNQYGQLGDGTATNRVYPIQVNNINNIRNISSGINSSIVLKNDGTVWAWGSNTIGQLGDGTTVNGYSPIEVSNMENVSFIGCGWYHTVALKNDGTVWAWGDNSSGQLGNGQMSGYSTTPVKVQINLLTINNAQLEQVSFKRIQASWIVSGISEGAAYTLAAFDENNNIIKQNDWTPNLTDTLTDLETNTTYKIKVKAKDTYGFTTEWYEIGEATTLPWNIALSISNITATTADLTIQDDNPETTEYQITSNNTYVNQAGELTDTPVWISIPSKSITLKGLTPDTAYSLQVKARTGFGEESEYSTKAFMETLKSVPDSPQTLELTSTSDSVTITWNQVNGAQSYEVYADELLIATLDDTTLSYIHKGLLPASYYTCKVRALNTTGAGEFSSTMTIKTKDELPLTPQNIALTAANTTVNISWDAVANAEYYEIEADGIIIYAGKKLSYKFTGFAPNTQHTYRIRAVNNTGMSSWSAYSSINTTSSLPEAPGNIKVYVTKTDIYISWNNTINAEGYEIEENGLIIDNGTHTYLSKTGLKPNTARTYRIRAKNSIGNGSWSEYIEAATYLLDTPSNIKTSQSQDYISLTWDAVQGAEIYEIQIDEEIVETVTMASFTHSGLEADTIHTYKIRAINAEGTSSWSNNITAATLPNKPQTVENITAIASQNSITLIWDSVEGATGYDVELDGILIYNGNKTTYVHEELDTNSQHIYKIRARTKYIKGDYSGEVLVSTLPEKPKAPSNIAIYAEPYIATIQWEQVPRALSYDIEINGEIINAGTAAEYVHRNINENIQYKYRIRTISAMGTSEWSGNILNSTVTVACRKNTVVDMGLGVTDIEDFSKYTLILKYDPDVMSVEDLCTLSPAIELEAGRVQGTDIIIEEFEPGKIVFKVDKPIPLGQNWSGLINSTKFKGKATGGSTITYTVYEDL